MIGFRNGHDRRDVEAAEARATVLEDRAARVATRVRRIIEEGTWARLTSV